MLLLNLCRQTVFREIADWPSRKLGFALVGPIASENTHEGRAGFDDTGDERLDTLFRGFTQFHKS